MEKVEAFSITEIVAAREDVADSSLSQLLEQLKQEKGLRILSEKMSETVKLETPPKNVKEAFSKVMELEMEFDDFARMFRYVMKYGPSALEIMAPKKIELPLNLAQELTNDLMGFMQRYAAAGLGGIVFIPQKKDAPTE